MEIVAGEISCYRLLAFISIKDEIALGGQHCRQSKPVFGLLK